MHEDSKNKDLQEVDDQVGKFGEALLRAQEKAQREFPDVPKDKNEWDRYNNRLLDHLFAVTGVDPRKAEN